jgi:hypothetical protein
MSYIDSYTNLNQRIAMKQIFIFLLILAGMNVITVSAQSIETAEYTLVYERNGLSGVEYVLWSTEKQTYLPQASACYAVSRNGVYIAYLSTDKTILRIHRLLDDSIVEQIVWEADWEACNFGWYDDAILAIFSISLQTDESFDITNDFAPITLPPFVPTILPDRSPVDDIGVYLPSPDGSFFLYETCSGTNCTGMGDYVIYDTSTETNLVFLNDAIISTPHYAPAGRVNRGSEAIWSFDGRYLAYPFLPQSLYTDFDLHLYDTTLRTIHEINAPNWRIDYAIPLTWSPVNYLLAFWIMGRIPEPIAGDTIELRHAIIYDANHETLVYSDQPFNMRGNAQTVWKPDGTAIVFITSDKNLIRVDTTTGITQLLDSNVNRILAWRN